MKEIVTVIEFTPSGILLVTGYVLNGRIYVLYSSESDKITLNDDYLLDTKECSTALSLLLADAQRVLKTSLGNYIVLLPAADFIVKTETGSSGTVSDIVTQRDYQNCFKLASKSARFSSHRVVYGDPISFSYDAENNCKDFPIDKRSDNLSVSFDVLMTSASSFDYYSKILSNQNIKPYLFCLTSFASCSYLNSFAAPNNYLALQIEREMIDISYIKDRRLAYCKTIYSGIDDIVSNACKTLNISFERGFELFKLYGLKEENDFAFITEDNMPLSTIVSAFRKAFESVIFSVNEEFDDVDPNMLLPIIFYGTFNDYDASDIFISTYCKRQVLLFTPKVIGARNKLYLPCLGGIRLSSLNYQKISEDNYTSISGNSFSRD